MKHLQAKDRTILNVQSSIVYVHVYWRAVFFFFPVFTGSLLHTQSDQWNSFKPLWKVWYIKQNEDPLIENSSIVLLEVKNSTRTLYVIKDSIHFLTWTFKRLWKLIVSTKRIFHSAHLILLIIHSRLWMNWNYFRLVCKKKHSELWSCSDFGETNKFWRLKPWPCACLVYFFKRNWI